MVDLLSLELMQGSNISGFHNKVSDMVFQNVWLAIVNGELAPGEPVTEESLAARYDVSRTPLREALQKLIGIGLIVRSKNRTMRIAELDLDSMTALSATRERLEGLIGLNVWERYSKGEISLDSLEAIHKRMKRLLTLEDPQILLGLGRQFHHELCVLSNNPIAVGVLEQLLLALEPYRRLVVGYVERLESIVSEHDAIISCLKGGDGAAVEVLMRSHITAARRFYKERLIDRIPAKHPRS